MKKDSKETSSKIKDIEIDKNDYSSKSEGDEQLENSDSIAENLLPVIAAGLDLELLPDSAPAKADSLAQYIREISRYRLLTPEEELELTQKLVETGDIEVAKRLVMANLRLVVKIAMEYKNAYQNVLDLIQEGNIGLMKAVSKYSPDKGAKLSYYASWWIKSYILKFILDNFRLVKVGTTKEQKKLFYNLMREKERLEAQGIRPEPKLIAQNLDVSEKAVIEMDQRLSGPSGEISLDRPLSSDGSGRSTVQDIFPSDDLDIDEMLADAQGLEILQDNLSDFIKDLKPRDKEIFKKRLLSEVPPSLQSIADDYGVSRERIRQIEERLLNKLKVYMSDFLR